MEAMRKIGKLLPGAAMALAVAAAARALEYLEGRLGLHLIGASVIALFIGMILNHFYKPNETTAPGIRFTSKKILKFAIILLGASLNLRRLRHRCHRAGDRRQRYGRGLWYVRHVPV